MMAGTLKILYAYYGLRDHIHQYCELSLPANAELPDGPVEEDFGAWQIVNVTTAIRYQLNTKEKCLDLRSSSLQDLIGVYNPVPDFRRDSHKLSLYLIYRLKNEETGEFILHRKYFDDGQPVRIGNVNN